MHIDRGPRRQEKNSTGVGQREARLKKGQQAHSSHPPYPCRRRMLRWGQKPSEKRAQGCGSQDEFGINLARVQSLAWGVDVVASNGRQICIVDLVS
jgi:hypothetical protein